jgi:hypothetical protein
MEKGSRKDVRKYRMAGGHEMEISTAGSDLKGLVPSYLLYISS